LSGSATASEARDQYIKHHSVCASKKSAQPVAPPPHADRNVLPNRYVLMFAKGIELISALTELVAN
jgi:hypothetical protein